MLRAAGPVVEVGSVVAAVDDRGGSVERIHDREAVRIGLATCTDPDPLAAALAMEFAMTAEQVPEPSTAVRVRDPGSRKWEWDAGHGRLVKRQEDAIVYPPRYRHIAEEVAERARAVGFIVEIVDV